MRLAENVKKFRAKKGLSQQELAKEIGARQNTIAAIESGKTKRTRYLPELARALDTTMAELDPNAGPNENLIVSGPQLLGDKDLPVHASVEAGEGAVVVSSEPVQYVRRPDPLATVRDGYGVIVVGESMSPVIKPGSIVLVHPHQPPRVGDFCLFILERNGEFNSTIKEYRGQTSDAWKVRRYGPAIKDFTLKKRDWPKVNVVVGQYFSR